jgi:hypothetical protein
MINIHDRTMTGRTLRPRKLSALTRLLEAVREIEPEVLTIDLHIFAGRLRIRYDYARSLLSAPPGRTALKALGWAILSPVGGQSLSVSALLVLRKPGCCC